MFFSKKKYNWSFEQVKKSILQKVGKENPTKWLNKEYEELSLDIKIKTNVLISPSTLKRIFGKSKTPDKYYPQKATLHALSKYAASFNQDAKINSRLFSRKAILTYFIIIALSISSAFIYLSSKKEDLNKESTLILLKLDSFAPSSAFFEYKISNTENHYCVDFGDARISEELDPKKSKITHFYRYPGVFKVKIVKNGEIASKEVDVFVPSNGWQALTYYYNIPHEERFFYPIPLEKASKNGEFYPPIPFLNSIGIDTTKPIMTQLANFSSTKTNGDSFSLEARLKGVGFWPGVQCYSTYIEIAGTDGHILVMFSSEGCSHWTVLELSEKIFEGENFDLSNFVLNQNEWSDVRILNINKNIEIRINKTSIYKEKYEKSIGNIAGVSIIFLTNGHIDYIRLFDSKSKLILGNDF